MCWEGFRSEFLENSKVTTSSGIIKTARTNVYSVYSSDSRRTVPDEPFAAILSFRYAVTKRSNAESSSFYFLVIGKRPSSQLLSAMGPLAVIFGTNT